MATDSSGPDSSDGGNGPGEVAKRVQNVSETITSYLRVVTPERTALVKKGVKVVFTISLTVLLVYWGIAYYFGVEWFSF